MLVQKQRKGNELMSDFLSNIGNKVKDTKVSPALQLGVELGEKLAEKAWRHF